MRVVGTDNAIVVSITVVFSAATAAAAATTVAFTFGAAASATPGSSVLNSFSFTNNKCDGFPTKS